MECINFMLTALAIAAGPILGAILGWIAKEELRPGKKYHILLQKAIFTLAIILLMYANRTNVHYIWVGAAAIFLYYSYYTQIQEAVIYAALAVIFYLGADTNLALPIISLTFLYGLPSGSLLLKNKKQILLNIIMFLLIAAILYFFP